ncbi:RagB/SusD family nutrient uptake outer membrane protein [Dysgonomonas sp. Marseille-P4677]|uniref:RagB/SusD family nutrient uptake outer membrane protein n=1 Tax=Dysgonomonas sp. Marseille-P4677 TaxID=2364790 RepID=UPI001911CDE2|nr:RagB/SusD family nutrient uptake outer membrane protein [Dysgonomonas sp. Marseille-P4677]MBK5721973.1 RagB/SusD family nutrient uptake outer membrane protein [Dysgonomonas sp. Marseille-P4677]
MKYINTIRITILNVILTLSLTGCSDWLRIEPVDAILDDQIYTSEYNTQVALNGIYLKMASEPLYGKELTNWSIELIAQQYAVSIGSKTSNPLKYYMNSYTYSDEVAKNRILKIWSDAYSTVLNINYFIKRLDTTEGIVSKKNKDIMLGEAYGLRAFMHFDMLRLFGPIYQTDSTSLSIPYYSDATIVLREREAANVIMDKIFIDIDRALEYLKEDPVIKEGAMAMTTDLSTYQYQFDEFYHFRNRRMNYYAVSALKARALLYRENKEEAAAVALSLLDNTTLSQHFPWVKKEDVDKNDMEDRIASPEVLFGIHSASMYSIWNLNFSPGVHFDAFLGATQVNVKYAFDMATTELALSTDYRASNLEII